jgi:hypothetical protein
LTVSGGKQFAIGQDSRDLQVCYDAGDVEIQLLDTIDSVYDFLRFLQISTRDSNQSTEAI